MSTLYDTSHGSLALVDSTGRAISLGKVVGKGGEGSVFEVDGQPDLVAKIFHQKPLSYERMAKLEAMVASTSKSLEAIAAWPKAILFDAANRQPCGLLMPRIKKSRELHELYGTTNRRQHFPEVRWHHLLLAARNIAAAFDTLHSQGIVVGDVNQGNMLVDARMCVRFIDCDSFQITSGERTYFCPVGTPHFTPQELQSQRLSETPRTTDHDGFGMAILIFHLLFVGRHPYAGRFRGAGDLQIEKAIAEGRFAFSRDKTKTLTDPPPASLWLNDLPPGLADLFEAAFQGCEGQRSPRPTPQQWAEQLDGLMQHREVCSFDPLHIYFNQLKSCPWCRIEDEGGPSFFVPDGGASIVSNNRLAELDSKIQLLRAIPFPDLPASRLELPKSAPFKRPEKAPRWTKADSAAALVATAGGLSLLGIASGYSLLAGAVLAIGGGAYLLLGSQGKGHRQAVDDSHAKSDELYHRLVNATQVIPAIHRKRKTAFDRATVDLKKEITRYQAEGEELKAIIKEHSGSHRDNFLKRFLIRDHLDVIPGLNASTISMLESFGVESSRDISQLSLYGVPNIDSELTMELLQWRATHEREFVFKPDHGVTVQDLQRSEETATQRFKISQARRVLMGAKQFEDLAKVGEYELKQLLGKFDNLTSQWREIAKELWRYQNERRPLERWINRSKWTVASLMAGIPVVGWLLWGMFG